MSPINSGRVNAEWAGPRRAAITTSRSAEPRSARSASWTARSGTRTAVPTWACRSSSKLRVAGFPARASRSTGRWPRLLCCPPRAAREWAISWPCRSRIMVSIPESACTWPRNSDSGSSLISPTRSRSAAGIARVTARRPVTADRKVSDQVAAFRSRASRKAGQRLIGLRMPRERRPRRRAGGQRPRPPPGRCTRATGWSGSRPTPRECGRASRLRAPPRR